MFDCIQFNSLVREIYKEEFIPLHRPIFSDLENQYLSECIDSNFVSSVGERVTDFEKRIAKFVGVDRAIACANGTAALHVILHALGVKRHTQVLTQALSFVATSNAINYCGADPIFIDVDLDTLGMSPDALRDWLDNNTVISTNGCVNRKNGKVISACLPMHTFGIPVRINEIKQICSEYSINLVEDCAESLGSFVGGSHTGTFGVAAAVSFNGNKIITTGGGGAIFTNDIELADRLKHLTTTAKKTHSYEYFHDELGFNYRMPNINAAVGVAQMEILDMILHHKQEVAQKYREFFRSTSVKLIEPLIGCTSNNWLNGIIFSNRNERDNFLKITNSNGVMTRPIWHLLSELPMYNNCEKDELKNSKWLVDRVVNIPSSVPSLG